MPWVRVFRRERRYAVAEALELVDCCRRDDVRADRQHLPELDEGWTEPLQQRLPQDVGAVRGSLAIEIASEDTPQTT